MTLTTMIAAMSWPAIWESISKIGHTFAEAEAGAELRYRYMSEGEQGDRRSWSLFMGLISNDNNNSIKMRVGTRRKTGDCQALEAEAEAEAIEF